MSDAQKLIEEGVALLRRGRTAKARSCFEQAYAENPADALCLSYVGVALALTDKNYKDAEDYCFRAVLRSMANPQLHANLAWVYHLQGKRKSTVDSIEEALSRDPKCVDALRIQGIIGKRRRPPIGVLKREHPINKAIGKLTYKLKNS